MRPRKNDGAGSQKWPTIKYRRVHKKLYQQDTMQSKGSTISSSLIRRLWVAFILLISSLPSLGQSNSPLQPGILTCEYIQNPLGIAESAPRLSWTLLSDKRNQQQSAYELEVSNQLPTSKKFTANIWATKRVESNQHIHLVYAGLTYMKMAV